MEPILDETSLVPCPSRSPAVRIKVLAQALTALDGLGVVRVLRSVRDAADRELAGGRGLRSWCFDPATDHTAGRLLALRLASQPFIDGDRGMFAAAEGAYAVEAKVDGVIALGPGLAALTDGILTPLTSAKSPTGGERSVVLTYVDESSQRDETIQIRAFASPDEVACERSTLIERVDRSVADGKVLLARLPTLFPRLRLGPTAVDQIAVLTGSEPVFRQLLRHLRTLDGSANNWLEGEPFEPSGVTYSVESPSTLTNRTMGPMRDFPMPKGFALRRWSLHTKLTGGNGARMYFSAEREDGQPVVLIGYFGDHLPTTKHRT